jgi:hypothetical protein
LAIARVAGGDWEKRIRLSATKLASGGSDGASETIPHQILAALQAFFGEHADRADTNTILEGLNNTGEFADVNHGRGLTAQYMAKLLKPYGIVPRVQKMADGKTLRGYCLADCEPAFARYLTDPMAKVMPGIRNPVTSAAIIGENAVLPNVTMGDGYVSKNVTSTNVDGQSYGVADSNHPTDDNETLRI